MGVDIGTISVILLIGMLALLAIGMPLGFASGFLAVVVMVLKFEPTILTDPFVHGFNFEAWKWGEGFLTRSFGSGPMNILAQRLYGITTNYVLISVPLFIFMAVLLERSGIARDMYSSLSMWMNRTRGGIAVVTAVMAIVMAAMSGIIGGEVVLLGLIALPQMLRLGYNQNLAIGTICASGSLGTMIPPSIVLIFYGLITETSIHALFKAAFLPGFMLAGCYIIYILVRTRLQPELAPLPEPSPDDLTFEQKSLFGTMLLAIIGFVASIIIVLRSLMLQAGLSKIEESTWFQDPLTPWAFGVIALLLGYHIFGIHGREVAKESWERGKGMVQPLLVVFIVLGSIYGGVTGITEAAAMGSIAVLVLIWLRGEFSFTLLREASMRTFKSTGTIIWVTFGATALAGAYTIAGGPTYVANLIIGSDLPTMGILLTMMVTLLFMGAFMDWVGIVLLIIPVFLPIVLRLPIEEIGLFGQLDRSQVAIWFGVLFCMNMQVSFLSPPFGPAAFYLKSVAPPHISLTDIFKGFLPFIGIQLLALSVLLIWPPIVAVLL